jgi:hypothetical protein
MAQQQIYRVVIRVNGNEVADIRSLDEEMLWQAVLTIVRQWAIPGNSITMEEFYDNPDESKPN